MIAHRTSLALLRNLIRNNRSKKVQLEKQIGVYSSLLREGTTSTQWSDLQTWCSSAATKVAEATKHKQIEKFDKLYYRKYSRGVDPRKVVRNLSKGSLSSDEERVLALGLNYAVPPKTIPTDVIIAATEATAKQLDSRTAETLRSKISRALQTSTTGNFIDHSFLLFITSSAFDSH